MKRSTHFNQKSIHPVSRSSKVSKKRKAPFDEIFVTKYIKVANNKRRRLRLEQFVTYLDPRKRVKIDEAYLLTPLNKLIKKTDKLVKDLVDAGYDVNDGVIKKVRININLEYNDYEDYYNPSIFFEGDNREEIREIILYNRHVKRNPIKYPSRRTAVIRKRFTGIEHMQREIRTLHQKQTCQYRFDVWVGYSLRNIETGEASEYLPSYHTSLFPDGSPLINTSINQVLEQVTSENLVEKSKRPNTKYYMERFREFVLLVTSIPEVLIGATLKLPDYIKDSKSIIGFEDVPNNLCFWYCLTKHLNPNKRIDRMRNVVNAIFRDFYGKSPDETYQGINLEDMPQAEQHFKVKFNIYNFQKDSVEFHWHSSSEFENIVNLNLYREPQTERHHFSYIKTIHNISRVFKCGDCDAFFSAYKKLKPHSLICNKGKPSVSFAEGNYSPAQSIFVHLEEVGVVVPEELRFYQSFLFYDFETYLKPFKSEESESKLKYHGTHELLSISICGSEEAEPIFIPVKSTTKEALQLMLHHMETLRKTYIQNMYTHYTPYFQQLSLLEDDFKRKYLMRRFIDWVEEIPCYGFNSGKYDLNTVKEYLPQLLLNNKKKFGSISKKEKQWLKTVENDLGYGLQHNHWLSNFNVDGFDKETKTIYEFHGCYFHGHDKCYNSEEINPLKGCTMGSLYKKTIERETKLRELGYKLVSKWECDFHVPKDCQVSGIIKLNQTYRMISNGMFNFKDIMSFLGPNTSFDKFLKAFDTMIPKGVFPHRMTQNIGKYIEENPDVAHLKDNVIELLKHSAIPDKKWFFNEMTRKQIEDSVYLGIKLKYNNVYELLRDYNNQDVFPGIEATKKLCKFYKNLGLDVHKDAISISGLALKYLWKVKEEDSEFQLFKGFEDLYYKYKNNLVGGASIVFNHYQEKDKTKIRCSKWCKSIQGFDANGLYLWALMQEMLVGDHHVIDPYDGIIKDVLENRFFGVIECSIKVPDHLKEYFADYLPVFKNVEVGYEDLSEETKQQVKLKLKNLH